MRLRFLLLALLAALLACKSSAPKPDEDVPPPSAPESPENPPEDHLTGGPQLHGLQGRPSEAYAPDARVNLKKGMDALADHSYDDAQRYFEYVRTHYPFRDEAKVAEVRLADTEYARENWVEARDRYLAFVKAHPTHALADYAAFRAALTHYEDGPSKLFFLPPAYEKDLTEIEAALAQMRAFERDYPDSKYLPMAKKVVERCTTLLAQHELYAADFYAKRDHWAGAANRLETLVTRYPESPLAPDALLKLHDFYLRLKKPDQAKHALERLVQNYPKSSDAERARKLLGS